MRRVALLRGINVGGHRRVPMAELRALAEGLGLLDVESYIQSGNLVYTAPTSTAGTAEVLEAAIEERFGFAVPVIVRDAAQWRRYLKACPLLDAVKERPKSVHLCLCRAPPARGAAELLRARCAPGESVATASDALWIDYAHGVGRSRLTPASLDKALGGPATARNWTTAETLLRMLG